MKLPELKKMYYFMDESGDPVFFDKKGNDLVANGKSSRIFLVGYMECESPNKIYKALEKIRYEIQYKKNKSFKQLGGFRRARHGACFHRSRTLISK
jgi:hypothetical protein